MLTTNLLDALANLNDHDPETCPICSMFNGSGLKEAVNSARDRNLFSAFNPPSLPQYDPPEPPKPEATTEEAPKPKAEPKPGNREREAVFRMVIAVEKALRKLPTSSVGRVAGFLQGAGWVGDKTAKGNALALYLTNGRFAYWTEGSLYNAMSEVNVLVEANGIIVENDKYQVCINPPSWLESFITLLRNREYPELLV